MPPQAPSPSPSHLIRAHDSQVTVVSFSEDNERLYSGDLTGKVVITSTRTLRPLASWPAHTDGILGLQEWNNDVVTHGRDNKLHVWGGIVSQESITDTATRTNLPTPELKYSLDVNALNFCRFSLSPVSSKDSGSSSKENLALLAVPNLVESSLVVDISNTHVVRMTYILLYQADVWELPSMQRLHAAIGKANSGLPSGPVSLDGRGDTKTGILMAIHLFFQPGETVNNSEFAEANLRLLAAYESGEVALQRCISNFRERSIEGKGWECIWKTKVHAESIMAMAVSPSCSFALTVSADHLIVKYSIATSGEKDEEPISPRGEKFRIKQAGNGAISIRDDGRVCAVGGWDGKIRLFSTKTMKPLGSLSYHAKSCKAVEFAHELSSDAKRVPSADIEDDDMAQEEKEARCRWLAAGSEDTRMSLWDLMDFRKET